MNKYVILIFLLLFIWSFYIEPNLIVIKKYKFNNPQKRRIVFISDLHIGKYDKSRLKRIVKKINELKPDLVLSGGDYIKGHNGKTTMQIEEQVKELAKINAPIISVLGNHDSWYDKYRVKKALESIGAVVLNNNNTKFEDLYIAGVEDTQTSIANIDAALENTECPRILLTHSPDIYYDIHQDVDLILAGHVHGGQVRVPFGGALICPSKFGTKFSKGDFKETQNRMIVSGGLGTSILTVRFNNLPEIVVIE